ncbi:VIT1/CCC1 transporter family protein [Ahrensia marina]|uniref:Membrane protein n=1 Tax=Ahrensia marina TaxID=1514904 RepID=A0A0N0E6Y1_9HYPH|nr:VIT family protein [Ahrensia marina]KPB00548.1 membrane protein [Ahrensia marina]
MSPDFPSAHPDDPHYISRSGWLRAAVLGANDGIVSISSLIVGVAAASSDQTSILIAGLAGLVAGAMSMASGEYVSVSSQADIEKADIKREAAALKENHKEEFDELAAIYELRGLKRETAEQVAHELTEDDPLRAHIRDELGLSEHQSANPLQAAFASAFTFSMAAALPLLAAFFAPSDAIIMTVLITTIAALIMLGALGAKLGGAPIVPAAIRVLIWGTIAMAITACVGWAFGVTLD